MKHSLDLDTSLNIPIFQQIAEGLERQILTGKLAVGDFLPSVRDLAVAESVNPNTVSKAYQILQTQGWVEAIRGLGLKVSQSSTHSVNRRRDFILRKKTEELVLLAASLGYSSRDLIQILKDVKKETA